jgi:hypothetical protein
MGKHTSYQRQKERVQRNQVNPVMRGIGCILIVLIPILAYGSAVYLVNYGERSGWPIPLVWLGTPGIYPLLWKLGGLTVVLNYIQAQNNLVANLIFAIAIAIVIFGILAIIYGAIYRIFGPPQYGPTDVPPMRGVKVKRYKR